MQTLIRRRVLLRLIWSALFANIQNVPVSQQYSDVTVTRLARLLITATWISSSAKFVYIGLRNFGVCIPWLDCKQSTLKRLDEWQTVLALFRCRVLQRLIQIYTVCSAMFPIRKVIVVFSSNLPKNNTPSRGVRTWRILISLHSLVRACTSRFQQFGRPRY